MAKIYIKKVEVVNKTYFKKLGIDPASLGLSQRKFTDQLITLVKPCSNRDTREGVWQLILDFVAATNGKSRDEIRNTFRSIMIQIERSSDAMDSRREIKFDINVYAWGSIIDRLRGQE